MPVITIKIAKGRPVETKRALAAAVTQAVAGRYFAWPPSKFGKNAACSPIKGRKAQIWYTNAMPV